MGPKEINNECGKTIVVGKLFIWAMYRGQRKCTILARKQGMWEKWIQVSL
jgi:hypothetical protein